MTLQNQIRTLLRKKPEGLTIKQMRPDLITTKKPNVIRKCLDRMPDAYIDRWIKGMRGQYESIWCVVIPPAHCPHPTDRYHKPKTQWIQA
jgi:hypothetical protein